MRKFSPRDTWERIRTTPGLPRDVAASVFMVVVGVAGAVLIVTSLATGLPFGERTIVRAEFEAVNGLNPAAQPDVTIAGVSVGYVEGAENTDRGTAIVRLNISPEHEVFENARVILRPKNPLNDMQIELNPGGPPAPPLEDGVIPLGQNTRPIQADEVLSHLDERSQLAVTSLLVESDAALARAPQELPPGIDRTTGTVVGLRPVVEALQSRRENIGELVTSLARISQAAGANDERLARLADATQKTLTTLADNDGQLRASLDQVPDLSAELRNALGGTQRLTDELDPTLDELGRASEDLPPALSDLRGTVEKVDDVVDAAKPFVAKAKPVVADLRPLVSDVRESLESLTPVTDRLPKDTEIVVSYLTELRAFVYNTRSVFGAGDAQGSIIRGHVAVPSGAFVLPQEPGFAPGPENGLAGRDPRNPAIPPAETVSEGGS